MRLEKLKLIGEFKSLKGTQEAPFEYTFNPPSENTTGLSPICLVGLNGSGKSNLIELIADIFSYADRYSNKLYQCKGDLGYNFEITYTIDIRNQPEQVLLSSEESIMKINGENYDNANHLDVLPSSVLAYSSGLNQGLSSVFAKNQIALFDVIRNQGLYNQKFNNLYSKLTGRDDRNDEYITELLNNLLTDTLEKSPELFHEFDRPDRQNQFDYIVAQPVKPELPKSVYFDHQTSQLAFIYLFVKKDRSFSEFLSDEIKVNRLISFEIDFHLNSYRNLDFVKDEVKRLFELSDSPEQTFNIETNTGLLRYTLNNEFYSKLERLYIDVDAFYENLFFLSLLSAKRWSADEKKSLRTSKHIRNVPNVSGGHPPIRLLNVKLELSEPRVITTYDRLSDGEHQFIQLMATLLVENNGQSLFIFDEPESHFNPEWRSEFLSIIEKYVDISNSELIISTHSPFIVSACHANRMLHFKKEGGEIKISPMDVETYGAAFDTLLKSVFDFKALISQKPLNEIKELVRNGPTNDEQRNTLLQALNKFGESFELNYKRNRLQNMTFDEPPRQRIMKGEG